MTPQENAVLVSSANLEEAYMHRFGRGTAATARSAYEIDLGSSSAACQHGWGLDVQYGQELRELSVEFDSNLVDRGDPEA